MLYRIVIVDDEAVIREGIRDRIPWAELGFELAGEYADGHSALEAIRRDPPEAVITDIRMPRLDGIALSRAISEELPEVRVLLLTGHDEFEYAQKAIRLQVWDFLLKPMAARELSEVLQRLQRDLERSRRSRVERERLEQQLEEARPLVRERLLNELLLGSAPLASVLARLEEVGVQPDSGRVRVVLISRDPAEDSPSESLRDIALLNLVDEHLCRPLGAWSCTLPDGEVALVLVGPDGDLHARLDGLRRAVREQAAETVTVAVGPAYGRFADIRRSAAEARQALAQRFLYGGNRIIDATAAFGPATIRDASGAPAVAELSAAVRQVDRAAAHASIERIVDTVRTRRPIPSMAVLDLQRVLAALLDLEDDLGIDPAELDAGTANPFTHVAELPSLDAIGEWLLRYTDRLLDALEHRVRSQAQLKVQAAEDYIREHFADGDLSLTRVCDDLSVSVSYFSQRFKEITGKTFVEYLTNVRIEHAQALLRTGAGRSYEIAPQVGFRDPHYFSSTFKKVCGMTPTEYRNRHAVEGTG